MFHVIQDQGRGQVVADNADGVCDQQYAKGTVTTIQNKNRTNIRAMKYNPAVSPPIPSGGLNKNAMAKAVKADPPAINGRLKKPL